MKHIIELNQSDICKIIAEKFSTSKEYVHLNVNTEYEGYGPMETAVKVVTCKVHIYREDGDGE